MVEKIKQWRDDLSYEACTKIQKSIQIVCFIIFVGILICFRRDIQYVFLYLAIIGLFIAFEVELEIWLSNILKIQFKWSFERSQQLWRECERKLDRDEFTEVYYHISAYNGYEEATVEYYCDMNKCINPHWYAKLRNGNILLVLKDGDQVKREDEIDNVLFFARNFDFSKTE